jgi:histidinol-phosphate aminotransferase
VPAAQGNYVWLPCGAQSTDVAVAFDDAGLVVRPFGDDGVRITIGEEESVERVIAVAGAVLAALAAGHPGRIVR